MNTQTWQIRFNAWMQQVDDVLVAICGIGSMDLIDAPYAEMFEDGLSPLQAAQEALEANGYPF